MEAKTPFALMEVVSVRFLYGQNVDEIQFQYYDGNTTV